MIRTSPEGGPTRWDTSSHSAMVVRFNLGVRVLSIERKGPTCRYRDYYGVPKGPINVRIERVGVPEAGE
jgi:hypothetical protein